ncbi:MAG: hypothetical protein K2I72_02515 [Bacilli bacterium]|nr:hypothetical protein [Bacilli bacterium]
MSNQGYNFSTENGKVINFMAPDKEQIFLGDISFSLSKTCRYVGETTHFYSMAQHSLNCCKMARELYDEKTGLYLILHDAVGSYISDAPQDLRNLIIEASNLERNLSMAVHHHFKLEYPIENYRNRIWEINGRILVNEISEVIPKLGYMLPEGLEPYYSTDLDFKERPIEDVKKELEDTVNYLIKKI